MHARAVRALAGLLLFFLGLFLGEGEEPFFLGDSFFSSWWGWDGESKTQCETATDSQPASQTRSTRSRDRDDDESIIGLPCAGRA